MDKTVNKSPPCLRLLAGIVPSNSCSYSGQRGYLAVFALGNVGCAIGDCSIQVGAVSTIEVQGRSAKAERFFLGLQPLSAGSQNHLPRLSLPLEPGAG